MTPEEQKILKEKAELWDSLSPTLRTQFAAKFPYSETLQNTSNASSHIVVLEEEIEEWCGYCSQPIKNTTKQEVVELSKNGVIENDNRTFIERLRTQRPFCPPFQFFD